MGNYLYSGTIIFCCKAACLKEEGVLAHLVSSSALEIVARIYTDLSIVVILEGAKHGFAVRTMDDKYQWELASKAEDQAVAWFKRWFV